MSEKKASASSISTLMYTLAQENPATSVSKLVHVFWAIRATAMCGVEGDCVELGCHKGLTSVLIGRLLQEDNTGRTLHVFDSFEGLPPPGDRDRLGNVPLLRADKSVRFGITGEMKATKEQLLQNFCRFGVKRPIVHVGYFRETIPEKLPEKISFAFLDSDFYDSIYWSLESVFPRLSRGAMVLIDDYHAPETAPGGWSGFPAVREACDEFLADKGLKVEPLAGYHQDPREHFANRRLSMGLLRIMPTE